MIRQQLSREPGPLHAPAAGSHPGCAAGKSVEARPQARAERRPPRPRNYSWAELMRRVWSVDVLECPACRGRMRIVAAIHAPESIRRILVCLGLPSRAPPNAPAEPEADLAEFDRDLGPDPVGSFAE